MTWDEVAFTKQLEDRVNASDRTGAAALCQSLIEHLAESEAPYPGQQAKLVLEHLRDKRYFDLLQQVADAFIQSGQDADTVRRQYAQSLIENGQLTAAVTVLESLVAGTPTSSPEHREAVGLLGRARKQLYVNADNPGLARNRKYLERAARSYFDLYHTDPTRPIWHGINAVALLSRAARDGVPLEGMSEPAKLAEEILAGIEAKQLRNPDKWDFATAAEACLALNRHEDATDWIEKYARWPSSRAFDLASTLRQFTEVWRLDMSTPTGERILSALRAALLQREGGHVQISPGDVRATLSNFGPGGKFEKVFGNDSYLSVDWYLKGLERCRCVARIGKETAIGLGTGFVLPGKSLHNHLGEETVLLTNAHVVSNDPAVHADPRFEGVLNPDDAVITFQMQDAGQTVYAIKEAIWWSHPDQLDAFLVRLDKPVGGLAAFPVASNLPNVDGKTCVYVIGHPKGGTLTFSLQDNLLLDHEDPRLHYRTPTEGGHSGSPVFVGPQWKLVALHHAGGSHMKRLNSQPGEYEANEGIWIQAIVAALAKHFAG